MLDNQENSLNTKRETNKIGLETFALERNNILDRPVNILIKDLKKEIEKEYNEHNNWLKIKENDPVRYNELEEIAEQTGHSIDYQMHDNIRGISYLEEELITLYEMKIIYAFKHLEIEVKNLISSAYDDKSISKSSKWDNLINYLNSKNIDVKAIKQYREVNQLRTVNNSLKHSNEHLDKSLNGIEEFKKAEYINYEILEKFYSRIEDSSSTFLSFLSFAIYDNLYVFDEEKIDRISNSIVLRMDKENSDKLIEKIKEKYE
tara:strand:+ start:1439 stop:2221 length:783 start_codon:yes stop_codon:yes gene_type:complete